MDKKKSRKNSSRYQGSNWYSDLKNVVTIDAESERGNSLLEHSMDDIKAAIEDYYDVAGVEITGCGVGGRVSMTYSDPLEAPSWYEEEPIEERRPDRYYLWYRGQKLRELNDHNTILKTAAKNRKRPARERKVDLAPRRIIKS